MPSSKTWITTQFRGEQRPKGIFLGQWFSASFYQLDPRYPAGKARLSIGLYLKTRGILNLLFQLVSHCHPANHVTDSQPIFLIQPGSDKQTHFPFPCPRFSIFYQKDAVRTTLFSTTNVCCETENILLAKDLCIPEKSYS